jgi:hypothetical protein
VVLVGGLVLAGGGAVLAANDPPGGSSAKDQYCPPNSPNGGQPQGGPGNNCGNPPDKCPDGSPKPPPGNCGHGPKSTSEGTPTTGTKHPQSPGEGKPPKKKRATVRLHKHPSTGCVSGIFSARVSVSNKAKGRKVVVYRDGRRIKSSASSAFKVRFSVRRLSRGRHTVKVQVRGADGRLVTKVLHFTRC